MKCIICGNKYSNRDACPRCGQANNTEPTRAWHLKPGIVIKEKYVLGKSLGSGGFGVTYFAWDKSLQRKVAIKEYMPSEFATRAFGQNRLSIYGGDKKEQYNSGLEKYVDEAKRLAQLDKISGIAQIYDYFEDNSTGYIVMEYVPSITFKKYLEEAGGKIGYEKAITLMLPIMDALIETHRHNIIHRDISPENILITPDEDVKLIDFGASRYATTAHSKSLSVILKPGYAPEEQYRSKGKQGPWSDVYSVAATLYRAITGIVPEDSMERKANDTLKPLSKFKKLKIPKNISTAIMNALTRDHEFRYQTMKEFSDDLISDGNVSKLFAPKEEDSGFHIPPKVKKILASALIASLAISSFFIFRSFFRNEEKIKIDSKYSVNEINAPDFIGQNLSEAEKIAIEQNIIILATTMQNSDTVPADSVMNQTPTTGSIVTTNSTIELTISKGPIKNNIPDMRFGYLNDATNTLESLEFRIKVIEEESEYAPGTVIAQEYEPNTLVDRYEKINLTVSSGLTSIVLGNEVEIPNIIGKQFDTAHKLCIDKGIYLIQLNQSWSDTVPKGQIISQDIKKGTTIKTGETIGVEISKGIEQVEVPDVRIEYEEKAATDLLTQAKLLSKVVYKSSNSIREGYVISQAISPQSIVDKNTTVTLTISTGAEFSAYVESLPTSVLNNPEAYEIKEKTQYSYSDYLWKDGQWTNWSSSRQSGDFANNETRYHTKTYEWNPGSWTSYFIAKQTDDYCDSQTQYTSQTRSENYTWSTSTSLSGWTKTGSTQGSGTYTSWSAWSDYSTSNPGSSTLREVTNKTQYQYSRVLYYDTASSQWKSHYDLSYNGYKGFSQISAWLDSSYTYGGEYAGYSTYEGAYTNGNRWWWNQNTRTLYSSRTRTEILQYQYCQWGAWSAWGTWANGSAPSDTSTTQYKEQYRYQQKDYYWTDWGTWQNEVAPADSTAQKSETEYRYLTKDYYWNEFSPWSDDVVNTSDTKKVNTRTVYSYRLIVQ